MTSVLTEREIWTQTHTGRMPCEDWSCAAISQGITRSWENSPKEILPQSLQRKLDPADTLISDFGSPGCETINFCYLSHQFEVLCYGNPRKVTPAWLSHRPPNKKRGGVLDDHFLGGPEGCSGVVWSQSHQSLLCFLQPWSSALAPEFSQPSWHI